MNFGQSPYVAPDFLLAPNVGIDDIQTVASAATDPLQVFGATNQERTVNIALVLGVIGTAWLLLKKR